jgi:hypothetical protein
LKGWKSVPFYGWTANSKGQIRQATFAFYNNGTRKLTLKNFWINGTLLNSTGWGSYFGPELDPKTGERVFIVPKDMVFVKEMNYNFTIGTANESQYSFLYRCDEASVKPENLTITDCYFFTGILYETESISIRYVNYGKTPLIITKVWVDGSTFKPH